MSDAPIGPRLLTATLHVQAVGVDRWEYGFRISDEHRIANDLPVECCPESDLTTRVRAEVMMLLGTVMHRAATSEPYEEPGALTGWMRPLSPYRRMQDAALRDTAHL